MTQTAPLLINPLIFAQQQAHFAGEVAVQELSRLHHPLADATGKIRYDMQFRQNDERQIFITLSWRTRLRLVCQRCLQPFSLDLQYTSQLQAVLDDSKLEPLAEDVEPLVLNSHSHDFHLLELLTDEVLLQLPPAPKHPVDQCSRQLTDQEIEPTPARKQNPFANLRELIDKKDTG